jgi:hypothetical protein
MDMDEQKYIEQIINETGYKPTKKQLNFLNAMDELTRQEILLNLRNGYTSYGKMQPLPELLKSYGADEKFIKTAQKEITEWYFNNLGKIGEAAVKLDDFEMNYVHKFSLDKLKQLGLSVTAVEDAFKTDDHFKTGMAFTDPQMRTDLDNMLKKNIGFSIFEIEDALNKAPDTAKGLDPDDIDKLDFDGPDITLNPDGSTTERTPNMILNENVPKEDFKLMFGGNPYEKPLPEIFNDIKGTAPYEQTQFHLHSMNLEYQDRKKVLNWAMQQYDIAFEFAKDLSLEDKKILLDEMSLRLLRFDEKYNKITVKKDVNLSLEELTTFDNLIENDANNLRNELPGIVEEAKFKGMDANTTGSDEALGEMDFQEAEKSAGDFPPDQLEGEGPKEGDFGRDAPDEIDYKYQLVDDEFNKITNNIEMNNNIPKGSISKLGLALDPISEGLEFALKGIGLGSIANWWIKAEVANLVAGMIRGAGAGAGIAQLGQSQALMGEEITGNSEQILDTFKTNLGQQMKLSPSLWLENKYAGSKFGKGKTPTQQGYNWLKGLLNG